MTTPRLPLGIDDFQRLREGAYTNVDKTPSILSLLHNVRFVLLARPQGFGKTLLGISNEDVRQALAQGL